MRAQVDNAINFRALTLLSIASFVNQGLVSAQGPTTINSGQITQDLNLSGQNVHRVVASDHAILVDGSIIEGEFASKNKESVFFLGADQNLAAIPCHKILKLRIEDRGVVTSRQVSIGVTVTLEDGSRLQFSRLKEERGVFLAESETSNKVSFAQNLCRSIRFGTHSEHDSAWNDFIAAGPKTSDFVAIRKPGGVVDFIEVEVRSLNEGTVTVSLDGQELPVPISRIEGLVFQSRAHSLPYPLAIILCGEQQIAVSDFTATPDEISIQTVAGVSLTLPRQSFEVNYAPTHARTLSQLETKVVRWDPLRGLEYESLLPALLRPQSEPVTERIHVPGTGQCAVTELRGALELKIPLRREFGWIHGRASCISSDLATVVFRGDEGELLKLDQAALSGAGHRFSIPVSEVRALVIEVGPGALIRFEDLIFVKRQ